MKFNTGWRVLYVRSRHERKVFDALKSKDMDVFLPLKKVIRKWSDRKKTILEPLFPSYVFVNIHSPLEFHKALSTNGVCAYIRFGKEYARVSEKEIHQIKLLIEARDLADLQTVSDLPKVGDVRKITCGPLLGLDCEVLKVNNARKILVRINSLQQNITATMPSYYF